MYEEPSFHGSSKSLKPFSVDVGNSPESLPWDKISINSSRVERPTFPQGPIVLCHVLTDRGPPRVLWRDSLRKRPVGGCLTRLHTHSRPSHRPGPSGRRTVTGALYPCGWWEGYDKVPSVWYSCQRGVIFAVDVDLVPRDGSTSRTGVGGPVNRRGTLPPGVDTTLLLSTTVLSPLQVRSRGSRKNPHWDRSKGDVTSS